MVPDNRTTDRSTELVALELLGVVLEDLRRVLGDRIDLETSLEAVVRAQPARRVVLEERSAIAVAARLGDRADHAAECAAVFSFEARRLDLHFLKILEHRVLTLVAMDLADDRHTVNGEVVLTGGRAVHLEAALELALVHRRKRSRQCLEAAALRDHFELFGRDVLLMGG